MQTDQTRVTGSGGGPGSRGALRHTRQLKAHSSRSEVSDSEEERQKRMKLKRAVLSTVNQNELPVIVISSDDEDEPNLSVVAQNGSQSTQPTVEVGPEPTHDHSEDAHSESEPEDLPPVTPRRRHGQGSHTARRIVLSSDEDFASENETRTPRRPAGRQPPRVPDDDVIDLTLSSPESASAQSPVPSPTKPAVLLKKDGKGRTLKTTPDPRTPAKKPDGMLPLFLEDSESERDDGQELDRDSDKAGIDRDPFSGDDGAILVLDEPRSAQKPIRRPPPSSSTGTAAPGLTTPLAGPSKLQLTVSSGSASEEEVATIIKPKSRLKGVSESKLTTGSPGASTLTPKTPRMTKKALHERELERRRAYAQAFFEELNRSIFGGGIPASTELQWNKRLLTTAGRAHWHRQVACGRANKIMRKRPEIEVTTRHTYDIKCKYEWKCANCAKVYGRHSKSINPDEQACGVCKTGTLVPQFETRRAPPRTPKPKADSQNAAARSRGSSHTSTELYHVSCVLSSPGVRRRFSDNHAWSVPVPSPAKKPAAKTVTNLSEDDSDVEILAHTFKNVRIDAKSGLV
uniref:Eukaryotic-type serine/threonine kinase (Serine/threonine protein kinase) n=1 Tax=Ganoderma boninense TaxID=34458 RepID=A0A5K1K5D4_9APHY|nr:Eukaryotic-type serine/threonine kinase (Serine/threonine protein kinase) [Ganoderma boninense]